METCIVEGNISVKAVLLGKKRKVHKILVDAKKKDKDTAFILHKAKEAQVDIAYVKREEIDALAPEQYNIVTFKDGSQSKCKIVCDLMHLEGAEALGEYAEDFYAGMPAVTRHDYGKGKLYYIGSCMEVVGTDKILSMAAEDARVNPVAENGNGLEIVKRNGEEKSFYFVMNFKDEDLKIPEEFAGKMDLLSGNAVEKGEMLPKFGVKILEE